MDDAGNANHDTEVCSFYLLWKHVVQSECLQKGKLSMESLNSIGVICIDKYFLGSKKDFRTL